LPMCFTLSQDIFQLCKLVLEFLALFFGVSQLTPGVTNVQL
jgi:hypothetical protein